ncbi:MAG: TlpA family protein disulfide reductase [Deltaproteobacteria bacterium]|nr:TlpA family protein disulfide reductase [Deltaproteobacteria bacterium]
MKFLLALLCFLAPLNVLAAGVEVGEEAPDFTLPSRSGGDLSLSSLRGQPVILNMWASWCSPCVKEMPLFDALHDRLDGVGTVLALNVDEQRAPAEALLSRGKLDLPVVWDEGHAVIKGWGPKKMPTTFVIDAAGVVVERLEGELTEEEIAGLEAKVRALKPPAAP